MALSILADPENLARDILNRIPDRVKAVLGGNHLFINDLRSLLNLKDTCED